MENDPREARLPVWARNEIDRLRRNLDVAYGELRQAREAGASPGRVVIDHHEGSPVELGDQDITFRLGERDPRRPNRRLIRVSVIDDGESISVHGADGLTLRPVVSNVVEITTGADQ